MFSRLAYRVPTFQTLAHRSWQTVSRAWFSSASSSSSSSASSSTNHQQNHSHSQNHVKQGQPHSSHAPADIHSAVKEKVPKFKHDFNELKRHHGDKQIGVITVGAALGGMRGLNAMLCDTSDVGADTGVRFRGHTIPDLYQHLPKFAHKGSQPLPEGVFWLLLTGEVPTDVQVENLRIELQQRAKLPAHSIKIIDSFPHSMHPMTQLCAAVCTMQTQSRFAQAYQDGKMNKTNMWEYALEDSLDLVAQLPHVAARIYNNCYRHKKHSEGNPSLDWAGNFAHMIGLDHFDAQEMMRMYMSIHTDHEGGNVSAHACHLVGSALADPYLSYNAAMAGLAGPLHGLANQEVLRWILQFKETLGNKPITTENIEKACWDTLNSGQVIPGYGHAVLRVADPRYTCQREFALKYLPNDPLFALVSKLYEVVPDVLTKHGKTKNPYPNVDAHSGVILYHYGIKEMNYYTVLFGISRAMGVLAQFVYARILGLPIERPKSITSEWIRKQFESHTPRL